MKQTLFAQALALYAGNKSNLAKGCKVSRQTIMRWAKDETSRLAVEVLTSVIKAGEKKKK